MFYVRLMVTLWISLIVKLVKNHLQCWRPWLDSWVGKICWRRDGLPTPVFMGYPGALRQQRIHLQWGRPGFHPWVRKIPWRRAWQPTAVFLPGESPWTEEPGGLQSVRSQSQTRLSNQAQHTAQTSQIVYI